MWVVSLVAVSLQGRRYGTYGADLPGFTMAADLPAGGTLYFFSRKSRTRLAVPQSSPAPPASLWMSGQVEVSPWVLNSPG
jgi:hypothetical protein